MPSLDENACTAAIASIFQSIVHKTPLDIIHNIDAVGGKLYELYCVGKLLKLFQTKGWTATFTGGILSLKQGGGFARFSDPHFRIFDQGQLVGNLFTDIQVRSLGTTIGPVSDRSAHHEIDVVLLAPNHAVAPNRPEPDQLLIGLECKSSPHFKKHYVREVLGRRRELSFLDTSPTNPFGVLRSIPASAYWLVYPDVTGDKYKQSPALFDVELKHWQP